jgi:DNA-binding MarR family transcriptional regulator
MSTSEAISSDNSGIYEHLNIARNYLRRLDDFYAKAAVSHNATFEHYLVLLAVHCLGTSYLPLRVLAEHLVRDRTATGQLCRRMQQLGLLELAYESNSYRPQLLVTLSEHGGQVLKAITEDALTSREEYVSSLPADKRIDLAAAVRWWLDGLESGSAFSSSNTTGVRNPHHG